MTIRTARRVSQIFFVLLLVWFCVAATLGDRFWQLRGWPVNWLLELDPLTGLATLLATRTLYSGLLWGLATVALTVVLLTAPWHERSVRAVSARYDAPVWIHPQGRDRADARDREHFMLSKEPGSFASVFNAIAVSASSACFA